MENKTPIEIKAEAWATENAKFVPDRQSEIMLVAAFIAGSKATESAGVWVKASELPDVLPDIIVTQMENGRVFAYDKIHSLKGFDNVRQHHPEIMCLCLNKYKNDI